MIGTVTFGSWLERRRIRRGLSIEELGRHIGCSLSELATIEAGETRPSIQTARMLAHLFGVPAPQHPAFVLFAVSDLEEAGIATSSGIEQSAADTPWQVSPDPPNNLPAQLTSFVGREFDLGSIIELIDQPDLRLISLIGPPGIGKTRLALEAARRLHGAFQDGIFFVPLAQVAEPGLVASALAQALLAQHDTGQNPLEALKEALREREMLIVADNCEQVIAAGPVLAEMVRACPRIKMLLTTRQALHVQGEQLFHVPPMHLPRKDDHISLETLSRWDAIELFVQRAYAGQPQFRVEKSDVQVVADICRRLDGLPLGIELAASYTPIMAPRDILGRLDNRLKLLTGGSRDLAPRHQTMREAIAWSYDLLTEREKALFRRLAVFVGGFTLQDAEAGLLFGGDPEMAEQPATMELIYSLIGKSLLKHEEAVDGHTRLNMLETVREYGLEQLRANGEEAQARIAHARQMLHLAEEYAGFVTQANREPWLRKLDVELDNFRAALTWCLGEEGDTALVLQLAGALHWYWYFRKLVSEGRKWLSGAIEKASPRLSRILDCEETPAQSTTIEPIAPGASLEVLARACHATGRLAEYFTNRAEALPHLEKALSIYTRLGNQEQLAYTLMPLARIKAYAGDTESEALAARAAALFRQIGERWGLAYALDTWGDIAWVAGDIERAIQLKRESYALYEALGDKHLAAYELGQLALMVMQLGDLAASRSALQRVAHASRELGDTWNVAVALRGLGMVAHLEGDYSQAETYYRESVLLYSEIGDRQRMAGALRTLGHAILHTGQHDKALSIYRESLGICREMGRDTEVSLALLGIAGLAAAVGDGKVSAKLIGAALQGREASFSIMSSADLEHYRHSVKTLMGRLRTPEFRALIQQGEMLTLGQAVDLSETVSLLPQIEEYRKSRIAEVTDNTRAHYPAGVSKREAELLRLVALGLSNAEIADRLVLSPHTVRAHLYTIYSKINVTSRTAAARFAMENGMT